jgi:hypothetical protein
MSPIFRGTTNMPDLHFPNHPYREIAFKGDLCSICKTYRREPRARRLPSLLPWVLALGAVVLLGMAVSMALAEHVNVELWRAEYRSDRWVER